MIVETAQIGPFGTLRRQRLLGYWLLHSNSMNGHGAPLGTLLLALLLAGLLSTREPAVAALVSVDI